jgi:hypothetical protein
MSATAAAAFAPSIESWKDESSLDSPFRLDNDNSYVRWREEKLGNSEEEAETIDIIDLSDPSPAEIKSIRAACRVRNMAFYRAEPVPGDAQATRKALAAFISKLGLADFEQHRSSGDDGIVPIEVSEAGDQDGFIPYTDRAINWHTDGYYSYRSPRRMIRSMVLHCVRSAAEGGTNQLLDPDVAYIRVRDADPDYISALMHPDALAIPAFQDRGGPGHGEVRGPVFVVRDGQLGMRFTLRKRHVVWRDDPMLAAALQTLTTVLEHDPLIVQRRFGPGEGVVCNNVLHSRSAFVDAPAADGGRLMLRVRSYDHLGAATADPVTPVPQAGHQTWPSSAT